MADALEHLGWASGGIRDFAIPNPEGRTVTLEPIEGLRFNFFDDDEIVFDFDLSELSTQAAVDIVCVLAGAIGRATRQSVAFIPEGGLDAVVTYDPIGDSFVIHAQNPS